MSHIQLSIEANEESQEILIGLLNDLNAVGFEQTSTHLLAYFDEKDFTSYEVTKALDGFIFYTHLIEEQNWNQVWESNFEPVIIENFCAVRAHFHEPINDVVHEIIITPKMSFGTGHHATTYMMLQQMQQINFKNKTVFDFGTGTGVLAILAEKSGAVNIEGIDVDKWSIENALENVAQNNCTKISITKTSNLPQKAFDVVLANINKHVILNYLPHLKNTVAPDGSLLLSGLLVSDEADITNRAEGAGFTFLKKSVRNNWLFLLFINKA